jgi:hypothetical protein
MNLPEQVIFQQIERLRARLRRPVVVALDGGSGARKTTIAEILMRLTEIALVPVDDFYQTVIPESEWPHKTVEERLNGVFDWSRVRSESLEPLRAGRAGRWHAFSELVIKTRRRVYDEISELYLKQSADGPGSWTKTFSLFKNDVYDGRTESRIGAHNVLAAS